MVKKPVIIIDEEKVRRNILKMTEKVAAQNKEMRPHFKTHQSAEIAGWFKEQGVYRCAVSSFKMAEYFADNGWQDIMIAFPIIPGLVKDYDKLAENAIIGIFLSDPSAIFFLKQSNYPLNVYIELDTGDHRSGISAEKQDIIDKIIDELKTTTRHNFAGFAIHNGESYRTIGKEKIREIHERNMKILENFRYKDTMISYGDTPSLMVSDDFKPVDELRPGNFIFFDYMQYKLGSCNAGDIAMEVECPVVAVYQDRKQLIIHGGAIHFSKETITESDGKVHYGRIAETVPENGLFQEESYLESISQEHGVVSMPKEKIRKYKVGDVIRIIPVHSCLVAEIANEYTEKKSRRVIPKMKN